MKKKSSHLSPITKTIYESILMLPSPTNISFMWNFGSLLGMSLAIQLVSGIMVSMHYNSDATLAFESIIHIERDVNHGWLLKFIHMNGASLFMTFIYLHVGRGLLFSSFKKKETWASGIIIIFMLMATAFLGYVLPWGQMSFWGATVITNLVSAIPLVGENIVIWLWGNYSVSNSTLNRFFSLHFLMPFILSALVMIHIIMLHESGSSNPTGVKSNIDKMSFHPFFSVKDTLAPSVLLTILTAGMMINPFILGDPENFNPANPLSTPIHIQPEWYFLFAYAILRSIPNKLGGVIALILSIAIIFILSFKNKKTSSCKYNPKKKLLFWLTATSFFILTWGGGETNRSPIWKNNNINSSLLFLFYY